MDTTASLSIRGTKHSWESKNQTLHPKKSNYESRRSSQQAFHEFACQQTRAVVSRTSRQQSLISNLQASTTRRKPPTSRSSSPGSSALWLLLLSQLPLASSHSSPAPWLLLPALLLLSELPLTCSHGRLVEPPSRVSAWRQGFPTPTHYTDHETNCGGFGRQWQRNGGKCGVCGDPWDISQPREGEGGGRYTSLSVLLELFFFASNVLNGLTIFVLDIIVLYPLVFPPCHLQPPPGMAVV